MRVDVDATKVTALIKNAAKALPKDVDRALSITAQQGINIIQDRTAEGRGYRGRFMPYTPQYAKAKAEGWPGTASRRAFSGDPSGIVNLQVRGTMLSSMTSNKVSSTAYEISFSRAAENAKAYWNNRTRKFFGFNQQEKRQLARVFSKVVTR